MAVTFVKRRAQRIIGFLLGCGRRMLVHRKVLAVANILERVQAGYIETRHVIVWVLG